MGEGIASTVRDEMNRWRGLGEQRQGRGKTDCTAGERVYGGIYERDAYHAGPGGRTV